MKDQKGQNSLQISDRNLRMEKVPKLSSKYLKYKIYKSLYLALLMQENTKHSCNPKDIVKSVKFI